MKSSKKRDIIALSIIILIVASIVTMLLVLLLPKNHDNKPLEPTNEYVYITIDCLTIFDNMDKFDEDLIEYLPKDGYFIKNFAVPFVQGMTVMNVMTYLKSMEKITFSVDFWGSYIESVNHIPHKSCGKDSGWVYFVNGVFPEYSMVDYNLNVNDIIKLRFTCVMGDVFA